MSKLSESHSYVCTVFAVALLLLSMLALAACGGSSSTATSATTTTPSGTSTPQASPGAAAPERFMGSDPVAVTQKMVDDARAALHAPTAAKLAAGYNRDSVVEDLGLKVRFKGRADALKAFRANLRDYSGARWTAGYAGQGVTAIEERWDFSKSPPPGTIQLIAVATIRGGKVASEYDSYQMFTNLPDGTPLEPKPLKSAPGPADTSAAAETVALDYAASLQNKDAGALAALSAPQIAFLDTAVNFMPQQSLLGRYTSIFKAPADLMFTDLKYAVGRGWAAVIWTAASQSMNASGGGVTMLEIRDGKIARETLYYNSANMPF